MTDKKYWIDTERVAMNIVYQICDLLRTDVGLRQTHNDTMIGFTKKLLDQSVSEAVEVERRKIKYCLKKQGLNPIIDLSKL